MKSTEKPVAAYQRSPNLCDLLGSAKRKNPANASLSQPPGIFSAATPNTDVSPVPSRSSSKMAEQLTYLTTRERLREIKRRMTYKSTNLTYMIECKNM